MLTVAELEKQLPKGAQWKCHLTAVRPDSDSGAGLVSWTHDGIQVADFVTHMLYRKQLDMQRLAELLPEVPPDVAQDAWRAEYESLTASYVYVGGTSHVHSFADPTITVPWHGFRNIHRTRVPTEGNKGGMFVADYWLDNGALVADMAALLPGESELVTRDTHTVLNTYRKPVFPDGGEVDTFLEFAGHLVPKGVERELLLDWIATKVQRPAERMHGLVLVADNTGGTGRNTLALQILSRLIGYTNRVPLSHFLGRTYQSQYTDWLSGSLLVYIPEALDTTAEGNGWRERRKAYEAIKQNLETNAERQLIVRKGSQSTNEIVYASLLIATNHINALPIDETDRRLVVLENGKPLEKAAKRLQERIHAWYGSPENLGALQRWCEARRCTYQPTMHAPLTDCKARMIDASASGVDTGMLRMLDGMPGDIVTVAQVKHYFRWLRAEEDLQIGEVVTGHQFANLLRGKGCRRVADDTDYKVYIERKPYRPWVIRNAGKWCETAHGDDISKQRVAAEILKNGPPEPDSLAPFGKVPWR